jgi:hypothetical protein
MRRVRTTGRGQGAAVIAGLLVAGCTTAAMPVPGTPEYTAAILSRGYDCGLPVQRGRIIAQERRERRPEVVRAGQSYAVAAYRAPKGCGPSERQFVANELNRLSAERR